MKSKTEKFKGLAISPGIIQGRVCLFNEERHNKVATIRVREDIGEQESERFRNALRKAALQLTILKDDVTQKIGAAEAEIFVAQKMIMQDTKIQALILEHIEDHHLNAEGAVIRVLDSYEQKMLQMDNECLRERASDITEVKQRLLDIMSDLAPSLRCDNKHHCQKGRDRIVVAKELTPGLTVELSTRKVFGFVTEKGGLTSHAAILARALGIPCVTGIKDIYGTVSCGMQLLVDGGTGTVYLNPSEKLYKELSESQEKEAAACAAEPVEGFIVRANISVSSEVQEAQVQLAEGIGLYRTEFELFRTGRMLTEDEQYELYKEVIEAAEDKPISFRLFDIGGDKAPSSMVLQKEGNPYLGLRGSRLLLAHKELFVSQARALARTSCHGPVRVMYPMVIDGAQFKRLKVHFEKAVADIAAGTIKHGIMFEVPGACLQAEAILEEADFASIGTNDLIQYLFAVDRNNEQVAYDYHPDRDVFWQLISRIAAAAKKHGKPLSVCGELAGDTQYTQKFIKAGITEVSVSPLLIPAVRRAAMQAVSR